MKDVIGTLSAEVGSTASVCFRVELRLASSDDECGPVVLYRSWTTSPTHGAPVAPGTMSTLRALTDLEKRPPLSEPRVSRSSIC